MEDQPAQMCVNKMMIIDNLFHNVWFHFNTEKAEVFFKMITKVLNLHIFQILKANSLYAGLAAAERKHL